MLIVLKYGGNAMAADGAPDPMLDDVAARVREGDRIVLLHGGGPQIDAEVAARNIPQRRIGGLRVTDLATLAVTESVLCGTVNKALVRALLRRGVDAVGLSGQDGRLIVARSAAPVNGESLGFVGEIEQIHPLVLHRLLAAGMTPVVAPLAVSGDAATPLNVNADTAAGAIAGALGADAYVVVTNVERVRRVLADPESEIERLGADEAARLLEGGAFDGGMRPKIASALDALHRGARRAIVCGSGPAALTRALSGSGTTICSA